MVAKFDVPGVIIEGLAFLDNTSLLIYGSGGTLQLRNWKNHDVIRRFEGHEDAVYSCATSPDRTMLVTGSSHGGVHVWDVASGRLLVTLKRPHPDGKEETWSVAWSPDGKRLATGFATGTVQIWPLFA
ncbi:MAG: hypothetical protein R3E01_32380 [Pirellulaceae bacterium]|nr:hypothetical protein [Planctomycetales bacterium]